MTRTLALVACVRHSALLRAETCVARYTARVEWVDGAGHRGSIRHPDCQGCHVGALRAASVAAAAGTAPAPRRAMAPAATGAYARTTDPEGDRR